MDAGEFIRRSAKTRSWEKAPNLIKKLEDPEETPPTAPPEPIPPEPDPNRTKIDDAVETFLDDADSRGLQKSTQDKLIHLCRHQLLDWAKSQSLIYLDELTTANLTVFRNGWSDAALSKKKKHERL